MRFNVLDGWRGTCALLVALHHFQAQGHFFQVSFIRNGYLSVDFFFVLSGFVIAHSAVGRLDSRTDAARFVRRRFARLWPLHAVMLAAFVMVEAVKAGLMASGGFGAENAPFTGPTSVPAIASNLALAHGLGLHEAATWNFPSWSISTEFAAYLVFALLSLLAPARMVPAAVAIAVGSAMVVAAFSHEWLHTIADYGFFRCLYGFFVGVLVHRLHATIKTAPRLAGALEIPLLGAVVLFVAFADKGPLSMAAPLVFASAVLLFAFERGPVSRLLATAPFQRLGTWSYSIYLVHTLLLVVLGRAVNAVEALTGWTLTAPAAWNDESFRVLVLGNAWATDLAAILYLAAVIAVSAVTWKLIEVPGQRLLSRPMKARALSAKSGAGVMSGH